MRKLILISSIAVVMLGTSAKAQTKQYVRIETDRRKEGKIVSRTIKYEDGTIDINAKTITIDQEAPSPTYYKIVSVGALEAYDDGMSTQTYICVTEDKKGALKALKVIALLSPKKGLLDLIVQKSKSSDIAYVVSAD